VAVIRTRNNSQLKRSCQPVSQQLEVYIDYKSPYAFIAKDPTYALEQDFDVTIRWLPLTLNIGSYLGTAKVNNSGKVVDNQRSPRQWAAVKYAYMDARRYASLRGLTLRGTQKIWDSSLAAIGMLWAGQQHHDVLKGYTDRVYSRFWQRELDIEDPEVVTGVLAEAGADVAGFDAYRQGEGREYHDQLQDTILDRGYFGVPTYVIDGEVYFGREHLPRVRWHLGGAQGPYPDVANAAVLQP
jgi:2-hydroxychromene-2-carboxylate isomerase